MFTILVVDDEPQIRRFLSICLESQGYQILLTETARQGLESVAFKSPDLIIMDLGLPDMDGQELLVQLREFYKGPILVLSVRNTEKEKVSALDHGANDYIEKPFGANELLARIRSLLRTFANIEMPATHYDDGNLQVDMAKRRVLVSGVETHLSRREFDLLQMLIAYQGRIVTQQHLLKTLWGPSHAEDTHYLRIFIGRLRAKLGDKPTQPRYIETEAGVGYRFMEQE